MRVCLSVVLREPINPCRFCNEYGQMEACAVMRSGWRDTILCTVWVAEFLWCFMAFAQDPITRLQYSQKESTGLLGPSHLESSQGYELSYALKPTTGITSKLAALSYLLHGTSVNIC